MIRPEIIKNLHKSSESFNMTPVIDIVFLLIIFFMVVCKFIEAENFPLTVPDLCDQAAKNQKDQLNTTTVTVMNTADPKNAFAVGAEKISASSYNQAVQQMTSLIDISLAKVKSDKKIVNLRIDKNVPYKIAKYALAAISKSNATDIKLAATKEKLPENN